MRKRIIKISIIVLLLFALIYFVFFYAFHDVNKQKNFLKDQINVLNKEMAGLEDENKTLQQGILEVNQEEFLEREARVNLGYKKEGEKTVILKVTTTTTKSKEQFKKEANFWYKIQIWFDNMANGF